MESYSLIGQFLIERFLSPFSIFRLPLSNAFNSITFGDFFFQEIGKLTRDYEIQSQITAAAKACSSFLLYKYINEISVKMSLNRPINLMTINLLFIYLSKQSSLS